MPARTRHPALDAVQNTIAGREHNDRRAVETRAGLEQAQYIVAIQVRQANIEENQVRHIVLPVLQSLKSLNTIRKTGAIDASAPEGGFHNLAHNQRIVDDDYLVHSSASPLVSCFRYRRPVPFITNSYMLFPKIGR